MKILKQKYEIITPISDGGVEELKLIESVARECYKSNDKITGNGESARKLVTGLIKAGHEAMIEHGPSLTVKFTTDRGVTHEIVRHRLFSFAQESTRYCNYGKDKFENQINVIDIMPGVDLDPKLKNQDADYIGAIYTEWYRAMEDAERHYLALIEMGATPQIARGVLPQSTKATLCVTGNYREWRHFFKLRCDKAAHPQIREIAIPLLKELQQKLPIIFDDIVIEEEQQA